MAAWFVLVLELFAASSSLLLYWRVRCARSYVAVPARIIDRSIAGAFVDGVPVGRRYTLRVKYAYQVDGREFIDKRGAGIAILLGSVGVVMLVIAYVAFNV